MANSVVVFPIPELVPISELRLRQSGVLNRLSESPVILTQHGRATAVMVNPTQWNQIVERLEFLEDSLDAAEVRARIDAGEEPVSDWSEIEAELDALPDQSR